MDNVVRQVFLDIHIEGKAATVSFGEDVAEYCKDEFISEIEKQLDNYKNDTYTALDVLKINLGSISSYQWQASIKEKFDKVLREQLEEHFVQQMDPGTFTYDASKTLIEDTRYKALRKQLEKFAGDELPKVIAENSSFEDMIDEAFGFFLEKGFLPWWYPSETAPEIIRVYEEQLSSERASALLPKLRDNPTARERFIGIMGQNKIDSFLNLVGIPQEFMKSKSSIHKILTKTIAPKLKANKLRIAFWEALITESADKQQVSGNTKSIFLKSLLSHHHIQDEINAGDPEATSLPYLAFSKELQKLWPDLRIEEQFFRDVIKPPENQSHQKVGPGQKSASSKMDGPEYGGNPSPRKNDNGNAEKQELIHSKNASLSKTAGTDKNQAKPFDTEAQEGVYVQHAGIVLLHPFLASLFTKVRLLENGKWKNDSTVKKGVHFLAYLSTGSLQCPEYECLLFKQLCGLPWDTVIEPGPDLSPAELKEADGLMQSVLEHWTALKNTSAEGLREGFIERSGKLWKDENGWQLHVEQKTHDILLQQLPWGLGMIKFPWSKDLIWINWI